MYLPVIFQNVSQIDSVDGDNMHLFVGDLEQLEISNNRKS